MSRRLDGRRILVTGGASGIGLATARLCRSEGAAVAVLDLAAAPSDAPHSLRGDVADPDAVARLVEEAARRLGGIDGIVNAAGAVVHRSLAATTDEDWRYLLAVNLTGPMNVVRAALPHLRASSGAAIVNVASGAGLRPLPELGAYGATKAGLIMLGKVLAMELAADGIRVNTVCPGAVDTPLLGLSWQGSDDPEAVRSAIAGRYALKRIGRPEEQAEAIVFLLSGQAAYVTGSTLAVDGGRTFH